MAVETLNGKLKAFADYYISRAGSLAPDAEEREALYAQAQVLYSNANGTSQSPVLTDSDLLQTERDIKTHLNQDVDRAHLLLTRCGRVPVGDPERNQLFAAFREHVEYLCKTYALVKPVITGDHQVACFVRQLDMQLENMLDNP